jgi:hypothetical protein
VAARRHRVFSAAQRGEARSAVARRPMNGLNWSWIALMAAGAPLLGVLAAYPFWRRDEFIFGNLLGAALIFGTGLALVFREYVEVDQFTRACLEQGFMCQPTPGAFMRYSVYACIGLVEVFALFIVSLGVERRSRDRQYAPEWR